MHRAFAPDILKSENCNPRRTIAGCTFPFAIWLTVLGKPKCENIRNPRELLARSSPATLAVSLSLVGLPECCPPFSFFDVALGAAFDPDLGRFWFAFGAGRGLPAALPAALAALCCSWIALRCRLCSALLIFGCGRSCFELDASLFSGWGLDVLMVVRSGGGLLILTLWPFWLESKSDRVNI